MKKYKIGYTTGVFDMFHIGHLNLLVNAKKLCDYLIVGVNSDSLVKEYKHKTPVINEEDRKTIVENIKCVDRCIIVNTLDKKEVLNRIDFNVVFVGDDWAKNERWINTKKELSQLGIDVVFLPHTEGISSTVLRLCEKNKVLEEKQ